MREALILPRPWSGSGKRVEYDAGQTQSLWSWYRRIDLSERFSQNEALEN